MRVCVVEGVGCCWVPDGVMRSLASGLQSNSVAVNGIVITPRYFWLPNNVVPQDHH